MRIVLGLAAAALALSACNLFVIDDSSWRCKSDEQCERWNRRRPHCLFGSCQECGRDSNCGSDERCDRGQCCVTECAADDDARAIAGCYAVDAATLPCGAAVLPASLELRLEVVPTDRDGCLHDCAFLMSPTLIATGQRGEWSVRGDDLIVSADSGYSGVAIRLSRDADGNGLRGAAVPFVDAKAGRCHDVDVVLTRVPCPSQEPATERAT